MAHALVHAAYQQRCLKLKLKLNSCVANAQYQHAATFRSKNAVPIGALQHVFSTCYELLNAGAQLPAGHYTLVHFIEVVSILCFQRS